MREGKNEKKENGSVKAKVKRALALLLVLTVIGTNYPAALQVKAASEGSSAAGTEAAWDDGAATEHTGDISSNEDTADTAPEDTAGNGTGADGLKTDSTDNAALSGTENSGSEEVTEGEYEAPQVYESTSIDQTNATDQLTLFIYQVRYQEKDAKEVIIKTEENAEHVYHVDLSALNVGKLKSLAVEVGFKIVPLMTEKKVKSGDTFQYAFPENVFSLENTKEPVPVMNRDGADNDIELDEQIAFYEIEDNIIKVTFTDTILKGSIRFRAQKFRARI